MHKDTLKKSTKNQFTNSSIEARRRLKENLNFCLTEGWILHPCIIKNVDGQKKCTFLTDTNGERIIVKSEDDLHNCNSLLGISQKFPVLDLDDLNKIKIPKNFPKPFRVVRTFKGYHLYFHNGDIEKSHKLNGGEIQFKDCGIFLPGSYHPVGEMFYETIKETESTDKLYFKDIKPFLKKSKDTKSSWKKGSRNNTLNKLLYLDVKQNSGRKVPEILEKARKSGLSETEIQRTSQSVIKASVDKGVSFQEDEKTEKVTYIKKPTIEADIKARLEALKVKVRFNIRNQLPEIKYNDCKWQNLDDGKDKMLYSDIHQKVKCEEDKVKKISISDWNQHLKALVHRNEIDPFKEWLESLPKWDETKRLENVLTTLFTVKSDEKLAKWMFKTVLLMCIKRTFTPGIKFDVMSVLVGPQDIGKSSLWSCLFENEFWFSDSVSFSDKDKEILEVSYGAVLIENSEMSGTRKGEIEKIKSFLSRQYDKVRWAYGRQVSVIPRNFICVATTNEKNALPNDSTGLRRFLPVILDKKQKTVQLNGKRVREYIQQHRKQLWAEALYLYRQKTPHFLPSELQNTARIEAERNRMSNESLEEGVTDIVIPSNGNIPPKQTYTMNQILRQLVEKKILAPGQASMGIQKDIGSILRKLGFEKGVGKHTDHSGKSRQYKLWEYEGDPEPLIPEIKP